jgi:alpha-glucoside transport system substrate-binding protein
VLRPPGGRVFPCLLPAVDGQVHQRVAVVHGLGAAASGQYSGAITVGADVVVMVHDTPAARSLMSYLAGAPAQEAWIKLGGFTSVNRSVPSDTYLDPVGQAVAAEVANAKVVRFGAGDMMPASLQQAWWAAMLQLVKDPSQLDPILTALTSAAKSAT